VNGQRKINKRQTKQKNRSMWGNEDGSDEAQGRCQ
jgi:hypothetical protein